MKILRKGIRFDEKKGHYVASYPWIKPLWQLALPDNREAVYRSLIATENKLRKNLDHWKQYHKKIKSILDNNFARRVSEQELREWGDRPKFYNAQMAVISPDSNSTPLRIVFDNKRTYNGISLNSLIEEMPTPFASKIYELLIRFRDMVFALICDIKSMFDRVRNTIECSHMNRWLYRSDVNKEPDTYMFTRLAQGAAHAPTTAVECLKLGALRKEKEYPHVKAVLKGPGWMTSRHQLMKKMKS